MINKKTGARTRIEDDGREFTMNVFVRRVVPTQNRFSALRQDFHRHLVQIGVIKEKGE